LSTPNEAQPEPRDEPVVGVQHGDPVGRQRLDQLLFGPGDALDAAEIFQVHGGDAGHHAGVGLRDPRQLSDLAGVRHAHLKHAHLVLVIQPQQR
jgi:hypothetical protein